MRVYTVDEEISFGKYKGTPIRTIIDNDPGYIDWCLKEIESFFIVKNEEKKAFLLKIISNALDNDLANLGRMKNEFYDEIIFPIRKALGNALIQNSTTFIVNNEKTVKNLIENGENDYVEFKSSIRSDDPEKKSEYLIARAITGFMNSKGGILLIGVSDDGNVRGLKNGFEGCKNKDKYQLYIEERIIDRYIGKTYGKMYSISFPVIEEQTICEIGIKESQEPVYLIVDEKNKKHEFIVRKCGQSISLGPKDASEYHRRHFERRHRYDNTFNTSHDSITPKQRYRKIQNKDGKWNFQDTQNKFSIISPIWFDSVQNFNHYNLSSVVNDKKYNYLKSDGTLLCDDWLDWGSAFGRTGEARISKDGAYYLIDIFGKINPDKPVLKFSTRHWKN